MNPSLEDLLNLMLPRGRYLEKCAQPMEQLAIFPGGEPVDDPFEKFKLYDRKRNPIYYIFAGDLAKYKLWGCLKKDNDLAFKMKIDRYYLSRRKILSLRKNNTIKRTYKRIRAEKSL